MLSSHLYGYHETYRVPFLASLSNTLGILVKGTKYFTFNKTKINQLSF